MKVKVEDIKKMMDKRSKINNCPIEELEIYENGKKIPITKEIINEWIFMGLSNIDFITSGRYKEGINKN